MQVLDYLAQRDHCLDLENQTLLLQRRPPPPGNLLLLNSRAGAARTNFADQNPQVLLFLEPALHLPHSFLP